MVMVKLFLCLTKHHAVKKAKLHAFLTSVLDGGEWPELRAQAALNPG